MSGRCVHLCVSTFNTTQHEHVAHPHVRSCVRPKKNCVRHPRTVQLAFLRLCMRGDIMTGDFFVVVLCASISYIISYRRSSAGHFCKSQDPKTRLVCVCVHECECNDQHISHSLATVHRRLWVKLHRVLQMRFPCIFSPTRTCTPHGCGWADVSFAVHCEQYSDLNIIISRALQVMCV